MQKIIDLIEGPIRQFSSPYVFNPWSDVDPLDADQKNAAAHRRYRLLRHFECAPKLLMIGEAPGYQGCHFSGVAFTNEALLLKGTIPRIVTHGRVTTRDPPWSEPSATIVWRTLYELGIAETTVMWNAFAWHPHQRENLHSNRKPNQLELIDGIQVLSGVIELFSGVPIIAVGRVAEWTLARMSIKADACVRHPAMGGASKFRQQMRDLTWLV